MVILLSDLIGSLAGVLICLIGTGLLCRFMEADNDR